MNHILKWLLLIRVEQSWNKADFVLYAPTPLIIHFVSREQFISRDLDQLQAGFYIQQQKQTSAPHLARPSQLDFFRNTPVSLSSLLRRNPLTWDKHVGILLPRSSGSRMTFLRGWAQRKAATVQTVWSAAAPQDAFQRENVTHRRFLNYNEVGSGKRARLEDD